MLADWVPSDVVVAVLGAPEADEVHTELLRQWGSSEVWRLSYGLRSVVVKRGSDAQAGELGAYERFVLPLGLPAPEVLYGAGDVLVLADVGRVTLEQEPTAEGFVAAAELVARLREKTLDEPTDFPPERVEELAARIERAGQGGSAAPSRTGEGSCSGRASGSAERGGAARLGGVEVRRLVRAVERVHRDAGVGVVHGDFVPKNLVSDGTRWSVVDWPVAYAAPHLGDLYTLVREAVALGYDRGPIVARYVEVSGADPFLVDRQLLVGGACFCLLALTFVVEEGIRTIPGSEAWIAPLHSELTDLIEQLS
ncbi:phosphotransferase [Kribbella solani]|uniref:Aminoglycoside phosphotransferase domain-containing protein n=1 Tax=Kribbella solani TaxID=236067 RepID=A0A841DWL1_9ACTN|nr:phosphotransferase [Kribbella solani]MBB5983524.1 hypothetical protein [Kribbella solani]